MTRTLTAAPSTAGSILRFVEERRAGGAAALERDVLGGPLPTDPDARISASLVPALLVAAIDMLVQPDLPVMLAKTSSVRRFGALAYAVSSSGTLGEAFEQAARFLSLWNEGLTLAVVREAHDGVVELRPRAAAVDRGRAALLELSVAAVIATGREVTGVALAPRRIELAVATRSDPALAAHARCAIAHDAPVTRIVFDAATLGLPLPSADPALAAIVAEYAGARTGKSGSAETWRERTDSVLRASIERGQVDLADVARELHLSSRTLQRRLAEEHTTFAELLDEARHALALHHLSAGTLGPGEIAYALGFAELSAFYHAFRRWTGSTPVTWRRARLAAENNPMAPQRNARVLRGR